MVPNLKKTFSFVPESNTVSVQWKSILGSHRKWPIKCSAPSCANLVPDNKQTPESDPVAKENSNLSSWILRWRYSTWYTLHRTSQLIRFAIVADVDQLAKPTFHSRYAHTPFGVTEQSEGPMDTVSSMSDVADFNITLELKYTAKRLKQDYRHYRHH